MDGLAYEALGVPLGERILISDLSIARHVNQSLIYQSRGM